MKPSTYQHHPAAEVEKGWQTIMSHGLNVYSSSQEHKEKLPHMKLAVVSYPYTTLNHSGHKWFIS
jgi:triphosphoribosyl-dephospho-CoA synthetase